MRFSANLGFLWTDRALPDAIVAVKRAGFDAVECHWPYDVPAADIARALDETGLTMLGLNTRRGDVGAGENGLAALPGRTTEAQAAIAEAIAYAVATGTKAVHVMAGRASGAKARDTFLANLRYATQIAEAHGLTILIEPLNPHDAPGYFLSSTAEAQAIIAELDQDALRLMFDCYHVARTEGDVIARLRDCLPVIGHIQFAGVPDRGSPQTGTLDYREVFDEIASLGYDAPLGAEYKPGGPTEDSLGWMDSLR